MPFEPIKVADNVYWVGAVDWDCRSFHGHSYSTHRGTTYNAYLITGRRHVLVDTVHAPFAGEMFERISRIVDPAAIDDVVINHVEVDHSGSLPEVMRLNPQAAVYATAKGQEGLQAHYGAGLPVQVVKTGDTLDAGGISLTFLEAPMLHWPDSMFTYMPDRALLLSNDAFGQHLATSCRFADEVDPCQLMEEAAKYYANILLPFSKLVLKKIDELQRLGLPVEIIAPSHGLIWRQDPMQIVRSYKRWASHETTERVVVAYDTMWESTASMALALAEGIKSTGGEVKVFKIGVTDHSDVIREIMEARAVLIGSSTINNGILPTISPLLHEIKGLKPAGRFYGAFGSYGWGGGAVAEIEAALEAAGLKKAVESISAKWRPDTAVLRRCFDTGAAIAGMVRRG